MNVQFVVWTTVKLDMNIINILFLNEMVRLVYFMKELYTSYTQNCGYSHHMFLCIRFF